ncbi:MAG: SagB/ThcOx family dehydrogenase [Chitinispirillia bacterium]|nr:SagB/ThcOx family dehydrogenase [Chitinispirillia bacterium]MCL2241797.1 SagB/ThcOx family dehydrogenase [Chitinispirillia bacterium]
MKKLSIVTAILIGAALSLTHAQDLKPIQLKKPDMARKGTLMDALSKRQSIREYSGKMITDQELADLLWAANGINRPAENKRTAPSAMNVQDIDIYVMTAQGVYLYDAKKSTLEPVTAGDHRAQISTQPFVATAPVSLMLVSDLSRFTRGDDASKANLAALDAGIVSQNISLYCASANLATVVRAMIDADKMTPVLKLKPAQKIMLNMPVGYHK